MLDLALEVKTRDLKEKPNILRKKGIIPAVLYGHRVKNIFLGVDQKNFDKIFREAGESTLIYLNISGKKKPHQVLIKEVQRDPVSEKYLHIDFYQVKMTEKITAVVALKFRGKAAVVKDLGGVLVKNIQGIEVECLPRDLPKEIKVSLSPLKTFEDVIYIKDLDIPRNVEVLENPQEVVVSVTRPRSEKELEELEEKVEEKIEEVEGIKKEEPEESKPEPKASKEAGEEKKEGKSK